MLGSNSRPRLLDKPLETSIAEIVEDNSWALVGIIGQLFLDFRIHAARHEEDVRPAIVVQIDNSSAPTDIAALSAQLGSIRVVLEVRLAIVFVEHIGIVGKICLE